MNKEIIIRIIACVSGLVGIILCFFGIGAIQMYKEEHNRNGELKEQIARQENVINHIIKGDLVWTIKSE